jgi:hypothetical protein
MKFFNFYSIIVDNFCPPGFGSGSTTLNVKYIALTPKDEEKILSLQEGAGIKNSFFLHIGQRLENLPNLGQKIEYFVKKASFVVWGCV